MNNDNSSPTVVNCAFSGNSAANGKSLAFDSFMQRQPGTLLMTNCILWDLETILGDLRVRRHEIWNNDGSTLTICYSDVQGGWPGVGNISADPRFVDQLNGDLHVLPGSPCIDAGDNTAIPFKTTDLDGNGRLVDDLDTPDTGSPPDHKPIVDMGAYEYQRP